VIAAREWGGTVEVMKVPPHSKVVGKTAAQQRGNKILFSHELTNIAALKTSIGHRAIGVQYDPARESRNYVPSIIPNRYDAFIFMMKPKRYGHLARQLKMNPGYLSFRILILF
jgi:erythromycin esterase-like protein